MANLNLRVWSEQNIRNLITNGTLKYYKTVNNINSSPCHYFLPLDKTRAAEYFSFASYLEQFSVSILFTTFDNN